MADLTAVCGTASPWPQVAHYGIAMVSTVAIIAIIAWLLVGLRNRDGSSTSEPDPEETE